MKLSRNEALRKITEAHEGRLNRDIMLNEIKDNDIILDFSSYAFGLVDSGNLDKNKKFFINKLNSLFLELQKIDCENTNMRITNLKSTKEYNLIKTFIEDFYVITFILSKEEMKNIFNKIVLESLFTKEENSMIDLLRDDLFNL